MPNQELDEVIRMEEATALAALFKEQDLSQAVFGRRFEIGGQSMTSQYLNGTRPLNLKAATNFARGLGVSIGAFSPRLARLAKAASGQASGGDLVVQEARSNYGDDITISQFDTGGAMGHGVILRDQPGVIQSWHVSPDWITKNVRGYSAVRNLCIVTGFGDSMRPMFNPGDPLLVDVAVRVVEFEAVYFFRVDNEGFIKRLQRVPGVGMRVHSANREHYESWTITKDMDFEVFGRVLKVWRSEDF